MPVGSESKVELPIDQQRIRAKLAQPEGSVVPFPKKSLESCISERFESVVRMVPERLSLKTRSHAYTYEQLNQAANRVAHALLEQRGRTQEVVALLFENGAPFVVASLGALKAGKVQTPLESTFPRARLSTMLEQSEATALVTDSASLRLAKEIWSGPLINLDSMDDRISGENPGLTLSADTYLAVEYTSGSTGQPKGIVRNHRGVLHDVRRLTNTFHIGIHDRMITSRPSVVGYLYALLNGAATFPVNLGREEPLRFADWLRQEKITIYRSAVSAFRGLVGALSGIQEFPLLRLVALFGEPVYHTEIGLYRKYFSDHSVLACSLGCSEFGDYAYFFQDKKTFLAHGFIPGGYPIEGTEIRLLDDSRNALGVDQIGEIAIRSRYGAVGYWRRPDLTEAAFLPDPAGGEERIYRTGDLGRRKADGCLYHLGRKDFQVKIRGFRVELGEVESALLAVPGVKEAVVVGREDAPGDKQLVAYLVPAGEQTPTVSELRRLLSDRLPNYMVPSLFVTLDALPLTVTGKVDRRSLPSPECTRPALETAYVSPRSPLEESLTRLWAEVLRLDRVGIHDNFLELGGHSLLATTLVSRVLAQFQVPVTLRALFDSPTVAEMAEVIGKTLAGRTDDQKLDQMLADLEALSDEEARSLLDRESS